MSAPTGYLTLDQLHHAVAEGHVDTVIVAFTDMQGRLVGKRVSSRLFLDDIAEHGAEACNYLLAVDVEMNTVDGYAMSSWERGYGDMALIPDFTTLRMAPWLEASALVTADLRWLDGAPVEASPRRILQRQLERLAERGLTAFVGTELEFIVFDDSYRDAWGKGYRDLTPASDYNIDYALLASTRMEPLLRDIRNSMDGAGMYCEGVKGECNFGQQEIAFRYTDALGTCDNHSIYKNGAKEIADRHGKSLTFMAKFNEREGNSCHIHISLRSVDGAAVFSDPDAPHGMSTLFRRFLAGQLAAMRELTLFSAPNVNSYKRYVAGSFAPTAIAWGLDNRTCALRVVGHGHRPARREPRARRRRQPVPRGRRAHRRGPARHRRRARTRRAVRGQRLRERRRPRAGDAARVGRAVRRLRDRARGVRRRGRRALPEQCARRARGVRRGRHRLGARAWVRTTLSTRGSLRPGEPGRGRMPRCLCRRHPLP